MRMTDVKVGDARKSGMWRAEVTDFMGYEHHAYAATEEEARELLGMYILTNTTFLLSTVDEVDDYFGIHTEPVLPGVFCESAPSINLEGSS